MGPSGPWSGERDFARTRFNRATQAQRQPGSAFKPFIYATALATGFKVTDIVEDTPVSFPDATGEPWEPANYEGRFHGPVTLQEALEDSINVATIKLLSEVKPSRVGPPGSPGSGSRALLSPTSPSPWAPQR